MTFHSGTGSCLLGLIGRGIARSLTPAMHEAEGDANGIRVLYRLVDTQALDLDERDLPDLLRGGERLGFTGFNVTHPFKQEIVSLLDGMSDEARAIGAVNTVLLRDGKRIGHNTDVSGFAAAFRAGLPDAKRDRVVQLGAGGAGTAVGHAAMSLGVGELLIVDQSLERAESLARTLSNLYGTGRAIARPDTAGLLADADGLIHCTPTGMGGHPGLPLPATELHSGLWVADIVYFPLETELLRTARAIGCQTLDGGGMATFQAVHAFELFTGLKPDAGRMRQHFLSMTHR